MKVSMQIAFLLYEQMTALDLVGPYEILSRWPNSQSYCVGLKKGLVQTDSQLILHADYSLSDIQKADILVVPGAGNATLLTKYPEMLEWIKHIHTKTIWTTSVCTGSLILGAANILKGLKATTHWAAMDLLPQWGALPVNSRVVEDGKVITAAGVSAGIDMALRLSEKIQGPLFAQAMQLGLEYDPEPPFNVGSPQKAPKEMVERLKSQMTSRFEKQDIGSANSSR